MKLLSQLPCLDKGHRPFFRQVLEEKNESVWTKLGKRMKAPCMIVGDFNHSYIDVGANPIINF